VLRLLHTADWHIGKRFPSFPEDAQKKLSRARMDVVARILAVGRRHSVNAILCAGDLFDEPMPHPDFWEGLARIFREQAAPHPPVFLVPGNHDPLLSDSVWASQHPFRARLPPWVHVVDRDDFTFELAADAVLYASPCRSKSGQNDLALALPAREPDDTRLRIGCVHGCTFDLEGYQTNFPISRDAGLRRGLNYLAIGDTHSFRDVTAASPVPTVYPGTPEPTSFDESQAGRVAVVALFRHGVRPRVSAEPVGIWKWRDVHCRSLNELRNLLTMPDLERHVIRVHLDMSVTVAEESEIERILRELQGTDAAHGRAGVLLVDRTDFHLERGSGGAFPANLPPVIADTIARLDQMAADTLDETERANATRALAHLYKLLQTHEEPVERSR
jgi:DNA repair exonuclease SbcCD nuclease subunit